MAKNYDKEQVLIDWRTGEFTQRDLASKYHLSCGLINRMVKHVNKDISFKSPRFYTVKNYLYLITANEFDGLVKIGITNCLNDRIKQLQNGCPFKLFLLRKYEVENANAIEAMLHSFFFRKRLEGEWFRLDSLDISYIDSALENVSEVVNGKCKVH